jgi:hypothetical protein
MSLPEEERFRKCGEMFELAKLFIVRRAPANLSEKELSDFVFRELCGRDVPKRPVET